MFDHTSYVPVLRWKRGEQHALRNLDESYRKRLGERVRMKELLP